MRAILAALLDVGVGVVPVRAQPTVGPEQAHAIAREATVYGFPLVDSDRIQHACFVDRSNPEFKAPWNQIRNIPRIFMPEDRAVQTPNSDTPYSMLGQDLRTEPIVLSLPEVEPGRCYSIQRIDAYTFNLAYIGSSPSCGSTGRRPPRPIAPGNSPPCSACPERSAAAPPTDPVV